MAHSGTKEAHGAPAVEALPREPAALRQLFREGRYSGTTAGLVPGKTQANLVVLPQEYAADFAVYCERNVRPCPLLAVSGLGDPGFPTLAQGLDLRTDLPRYRVYREGRLIAEPTDVVSLWRDDLVSFALGCSYTFERQLREAGIPMKHAVLGLRVPMFVTDIDTLPAGSFRGRLVVSMRPMAPKEAARAAAITARFPQAHGAPIHVGDPAVLGIADLARPDFGDAVPVEEGEVAVFWACGVTPQLAIQAARPPLAITHSPGCMLITDLDDSAFARGPAP